MNTNTNTNTNKKKHIDFPKVKRTQFIIHHYAGSVTYETIGFMEKHRDILQKDLLDLIQTTQNQLLMDFFKEKSNDLNTNMNTNHFVTTKKKMMNTTTTTNTSTSSSNKNATKSLGSQFKMSLHRLMENIGSTNTHYIRCIKPNANKSPIEFNKKMIVDQLRSAGVIEAIRITRSGYPSRLSPKEMTLRYCCMFPSSMYQKKKSPRRQDSDDEYRYTCQLLMKAIGRKSPTEYQLGKTLVYLKSGVMEELEAMKSDFIYLEATCIQKIVLGFIERKRFMKKIDAVIVIQSFCRMVLEKNEFWLVRRAIICIQCRWKSYMYEKKHSSFLRSKEEFTEKKTFNDDFDDDEHEEEDEDTMNGGTPPSSPPGHHSHRMNRLQALKTKMKENNFVKGRSNSMKRIRNLNESVKNLSSSSRRNKKLMEDDNQQLRTENLRLKKELELMREQCVELQSIILEINKSRKR
jgi:myosin-5